MNKCCKLFLWSGLFSIASGCYASDIWHFGTEVDVLPYLLNGHYVSLTASQGHFKARGVITQFVSPDMFTQSGFKDNRVDVNALIIDYFPDPSRKGVWIGMGAEQWSGHVTDESSLTRKHYQTYLGTIGLGYVHYLAPHIYVNPWAGIHFPLAGDTKVEFGASTFNIKTSGEVSVKLGMRF